MTIRRAAARSLLLGALALASVVASARPAQAQLRTCVTVEGAGAATEDLSRLVRSEVDRHPTHHAASDACQAYLTVELIDLGAQEGRWLTGRINSQVPHREKIGPDGQVGAVERLLTMVLANDPYVLHDPNATTWLKRQQRALEVRSRMRAGVEAYELASWIGGRSLETLPGLALSVRREVSEFFIGVRLGGAVDPGSAARGRLRLRAQVDAQLEAAVYARPSANVSLFVSGLLGIVHQRFEGPAPFDGPDATGDATSTGLSIGARAGVEVLRISDVRGMAFLELQAPAFVSADPDHGVVDAWIPSASLGMGVLF